MIVNTVEDVSEVPTTLYGLGVNKDSFAANKGDLVVILDGKVRNRVTQSHTHPAPAPPQPPPQPPPYHPHTPALARMGVTP